MATQTFLQVMNKVLNKLRLSEVSTVSENDYAVTLGVIINEAKREIEDAWPWTMLRDTITISAVNGTQEYACTGMGERGRLVLDGYGNPLVWNDTEDVYMCQISQEEMYALSNSSSTQTGVPTHFSFEGKDGSNDPNIKFWPIPNASFTIKLRVYAPQADLSAGTDVPEVPFWPLVLLSYSKAVWERGEDRGYSFADAKRDADTALGDAIAHDAMKMPGSMELKVT